MITAEEFFKRSNDIIDTFKADLKIANEKFTADIAALQVEVNASDISKELQQSIVLGMMVKMDGLKF